MNTPSDEKLAEKVPEHDAETLEQLAEIGYNAYRATRHMGFMDEWPFTGLATKQAAQNFVAAVLRAAKPKVDALTAELEQVKARAEEAK